MGLNLQLALGKGGVESVKQDAFVGNRECHSFIKNGLPLNNKQSII